MIGMCIKNQSTHSRSQGLRNIDLTMLGGGLGVLAG